VKHDVAGCSQLAAKNRLQMTPTTKKNGTKNQKKKSVESKSQNVFKQ
jgi:hypothetical protein